MRLGAQRCSRREQEKNDRRETRARTRAPCGITSPGPTCLRSNPYTRTRTKTRAPALWRRPVHPAKPMQNHASASGQERLVRQLGPVLVVRSPALQCPPQGLKQRWSPRITPGTRKSQHPKISRRKANFSPLYYSTLQHGPSTPVVGRLQSQHSDAPQPRARNAQAERLVVLQPRVLLLE